MNLNHLPFSETYGEKKNGSMWCEWCDLTSFSVMFNYPLCMSRIVNHILISGPNEQIRFFTADQVWCFPVFFFPCVCFVGGLWSPKKSFVRSSSLSGRIWSGALTKQRFHLSKYSVVWIDGLWHWETGRLAAQLKHDIFIFFILFLGINLTQTSLRGMTACTPGKQVLGLSCVGF